jgi:hypothetical protein
MDLRIGLFHQLSTAISGLGMADGFKEMILPSAFRR